MLGKFKIWLAAGAASALVGCTVPINSIDSSAQRYADPGIGAVNTAEVGGQVYTQKNVIVMRGRKLDSPAKIYAGPFPMQLYGMYVRANGGAHYCGDVTNLDPLNRGKVTFICYTDAEFQAFNVPFREAEDIVNKPTNLQRVLEYGGRFGDSISLFYKEFNETQNGVFIRAAYTQEFKFTLSESPVIGVKGARIEVLNATNTGLTYKVIAPFPD